MSKRSQNLYQTLNLTFGTWQSRLGHRPWPLINLLGVQNRSAGRIVKKYLHPAAGRIDTANYLTLYFAAKPSRIIHFGLGMCDFGSEEIQNNTQVVLLQSLVE